jgi:hypothetical protein
MRKFLLLLVVCLVAMSFAAPAEACHRRCRRCNNGCNNNYAGSCQKGCRNGCGLLGRRCNNNATAAQCCQTQYTGYVQAPQQYQQYQGPPAIQVPAK